MTRPDRPAPLAAIFALTALNSMSTGVVTTGVFFITQQGYGFDKTQNNGLGVLQGLVYIAGALAAGPALSALRRRLPWLTTRTVLGVLLAALAALCALPSLWHSPAAIWWMIGLYNPLNGALWPILESYTSGGRSGRQLRSATGNYCVTWSSVLVLAFLLITPLCQRQPRLAILLLGALHVASIAFLPWFTPHPLAHGDVDHEPHPQSFHGLLVAFRWLLPLSYLLQSALSPYLPVACDRLEVPADWHAATSIGWLLPRAAMFVVLARSHAWHGRWSHPVAGGLCLLVGFALSVLAPTLGTRAAGLVVEGLGLLVFGLGMAAVYAGALYYAMEVGSAAVDAGGKHEALIGIGFASGPLFGLASAFAVAQGWLGADRFEWGVVVPVAAVALVMCACAGSAARRRVA